jgi:hypothetical protein
MQKKSLSNKTLKLEQQSKMKNIDDSIKFLKLKFGNLRSQFKN